MTRVKKVGTNGQDLFIYTYDIDNLEAGTYEFKYYSELGQCSDFVAAAIVAAEAPATATPAPATEKHRLQLQQHLKLQKRRHRTHQLHLV